MQCFDLPIYPLDYDLHVTSAYYYCGVIITVAVIMTGPSFSAGQSHHVALALTSPLLCLKINIVWTSSCSLVSAAQCRSKSHPHHSLLQNCGQNQGVSFYFVKCARLPVYVKICLILVSSFTLLLLLL